MIVKVKKIFVSEVHDYYEVSDLEVMQYLKSKGHKAADFSSILSVMQNISINEYKSAAIKIALNKNRHGDTPLKNVDTAPRLDNRIGKVVDSINSHDELCE